MKDYLFIFCSADGETLRKYVEAKDIKTAWIRAAEFAACYYGNNLDKIELVTIIER